MVDKNIRLKGKNKTTDVLDNLFPQTKAELVLVKDKKLSDVLEETTAQFQQTNKPLRYGNLEMPANFKPKLPATFYRDNDGVIKHNMDFQSRYKNGTKLYVQMNGNDLTGNGSPGKPFRTMTKAVSVAVAGTDSKYVIITNIPVFNRDEFVFNQTVTNKTISFVSENSYEKSSEVENVIGLLSTDYNASWTSEGGYVKSVITGSSFKKTIKGSDIYLKFRKQSLGGIVEVVVDGKNSSAKQFSTFSATAEIVEELIFWDLEEGEHEVAVTYVGPDPDASYGGTPNLLLHQSETFRTIYTDSSKSYKWSKDKTLLSSNAEYTWTEDGTGTYKTTRSSVRNVIDLMNIDTYGLPTPLRNVTSLIECQSTPNTWYVEGTTVWVHRLDNLKPILSNTIVNIGVAGVNPKLGAGGIVFFENFIFTPWITADVLSVTSDSINPVGELCLKDCMLIGQRNMNSRGNGLATDNIKDVFVFNAITAYNQLDGYNYHYTKIKEENKRDCFVVEYNCKAYDIGLDSQGSGSNNASSAHEGASILRIGTVGYRNTGATIIDVNGCYSILYDCHARTPMLDGVAGKGRAFSFTTEDSGREGKAYLINSSASDSDVSLVVDKTHKAYLSNFKYDSEINATGDVEWI